MKRAWAPKATTCALNAMLPTVRSLALALSAARTQTF